MKTLFLVFGLVSIIGSAADTKWPGIEPAQESRTFSEFENSDTPLTLLVRNSAGHPIYKLECHNGNYEGSSEINFSRDFQCALFALSGGTRTSWNLLASSQKPEQNSDWLNRGRMTANQIWGPCGADADYGRIRRFRLRGMTITFRFENLRWFPATDSDQRHRLEKFTFRVAVVPDKSAQTPDAEPVGSEPPASACK